MAQLTNDEVKALNASRISEGNRAKADAYAAIKSAEAAHGRYVFLTKHAGHAGLKNGRFWDCEANWQLMESWIAEQPGDTSINEDTLEKAFAACADRLAPPLDQKYERQTDARNVVAPTHVEPRPVLAEEIVAPFTKSQIREMGRDVRRYMEKGPAYVKALNVVLHS